MCDKRTRRKAAYELARTRRPARRPGGGRRLRHPGRPGRPHLGRAGPSCRRGRHLRGHHRVGRGPRHRAVVSSGRCPACPHERQPCHLGHAHGLGQVAGGAGHALHGSVQRPGLLLHSPHQSPGEREVLPALRVLWARLRGHDHRGQLHQPHGTHHLLHGRDSGKPRPGRGAGGRHSLCRHGRVPLLCRRRPRLGLAGPPHRAHQYQLFAHERHAGRHQRYRCPATGTQRPQRGRSGQRPAPRAPELRVHRHRARGHGGARPARGRCPHLHRALLARRGAQLRSGAGQLRRGRQGGARRHQGGLQGHQLQHGLRQDLAAPAGLRRGRAPRGHAAALPPAGGKARPGGPAARHLRHRHPGRGHQRAHPHRAAHRAHQVRRPQAAPPQRARVPPNRRARRAQRL